MMPTKDEILQIVKEEFKKTLEVEIAKALIHGYTNALDELLKRMEAKVFKPYDDYCEHRDSNGGSLECVALSDLRAEIERMKSE